MDTLTEFLLKDGQVVSELPGRRDATNYVEINVEPRDHGIAVEVFVLTPPHLNRPPLRRLIQHGIFRSLRRT
jgi:hypothetical protein